MAALQEGAHTAALACVHAAPHLHGAQHGGGPGRGARGGPRGPETWRGGGRRQRPGSRGLRAQRDSRRGPPRVITLSMRPAPARLRACGPARPTAGAGPGPRCRPSARPARWPRLQGRPRQERRLGRRSHTQPGRGEAGMGRGGASGSADPGRSRRTGEAGRVGTV